MRKYLIDGFSLLLMGLGFISVLWVTSSLSGFARSQQNGSAITSPNSVPAIQPPAASAEEAEEADDSQTQEPASPNPTDLLGQEYAPNSTTTEGYIYDPSGRRDPFKPILPEVEQKPSGDVVVSTDPLQAFELNQYKIIGIIWDINNPKAMVKDPQGKLYTIRKETKIGRSNGFVSSIREGAVLVVEPAFGEGGTQTAVTRVMLLSK